MYSNEDLEEIVGKKYMKDLADNFETFLDENENMIIVDGKKIDDVKAARKYVRKMIKKLRKGKYDEVFDMERLDELEPDQIRDIIMEKAPVPNIYDSELGYHV